MSYAKVDNLRLFCLPQLLLLLTVLLKLLSKMLDITFTQRYTTLLSSLGLHIANFIIICGSVIKDKCTNVFFWLCILQNCCSWRLIKFWNIRQVLVHMFNTKLVGHFKPPLSSRNKYSLTVQELLDKCPCLNKGAMNNIRSEFS